MKGGQSGMKGGQSGTKGGWRGGWEIRFRGEALQSRSQGQARTGPTVQRICYGGLRGQIWHVSGCS